MYKYDEETAKARIAGRIAKEFSEMSKEKDLFVNLGVGIPTMVADHIDSKRVFLQAENGMLGVGPAACEGECDPLLINAGRIKVTETPGCSYFDSCMSFGMIRGGHVDATVIGAFEADQEGNVANWIIPGGKMLGVGGAMDLVAGARRVYIAMQHLSKKGKPKILKKCTLPITGYEKIHAIVTEYAVFRFRNKNMYLEEICPNMTLNDLREITPAEYIVSDDMKKF